MLGIVLVNYNTSALTLECLRSIAAADQAGSVQVELIDNCSSAAEQAILREGVARTWPFAFNLVSMDRNTGFATASNTGIERLLARPAIGHVLLLNNDARLQPAALAVIRRFLEANPEADMVAARMHRMEAPGTVDSLGIALYASALASNRKHLHERLLGPTGGLGIYSRQLLETLRARHGTVFDERFFCYAEDTDLALRALLLGFRPHYIDDCLALHWGQASSGGGFSDFVLYHGIRNSIWTLAKTFPAGLLLVLSPLILALHAGIVLRHGSGGRWKVLARLYRDALRGLPAMLRSRRAIQRTRVIGSRGVWRHVTPRFYERQYLREAWRQLWRRPA